ncbi:uncharacterized protein [Notamacropus eugenii]|uniref:uncharacterized protein n=1 Tax=Notamacropus eugenii TaxID=9315 RepID=UPI003B6841E9
MSDCQVLHQSTSSKEQYEWTFCSSKECDDLEKQLAKAIMDIMNYTDFIGWGEDSIEETEHFNISRDSETLMDQTSPKFEDTSSTDSGDEGGLWFTAPVTCIEEECQKANVKDIVEEGTNKEGQVSLSYEAETLEDSLCKDNESIKEEEGDDAIQEKKGTRRRRMFSFFKYFQQRSKKQKKEQKEKSQIPTAKRNESRENVAADNTSRSCLGIVCFAKWWKK